MKTLCLWKLFQTFTQDPQVLNSKLINDTKGPGSPDPKFQINKWNKNTNVINTYLKKTIVVFFMWVQNHIFTGLVSMNKFLWFSICLSRMMHVLPSLLYLLEVAPQSIAALMRRVVHDGGGLPRHCIFLLFTLRSRVFVLFAHRVVLLSLLTPVYMILQLYSHLPFGRLIPVVKNIYMFMYCLPKPY